MYMNNLHMLKVMPCHDQEELDGELCKRGSRLAPSRRFAKKTPLSLRGFGAYINHQGHVSWFVQRHIGGRGGKQIRTVIGHMANMNIVQARKQAIIDLGKIAEGEDISLRKKALLEKQKQIVQAKTLGQLFDIY